MKSTWQKAFDWLLALILALLPVLTFVAPRLVVWCLVPLGLLALLGRDCARTPLWVAASVPLWSGTLWLVSVIWAAYPAEALQLAVERLPMLCGLSLCALTLPVLRESIWQKALPIFAWLSAAMVAMIWIETALNYPINRFYYTWSGQDSRMLIEAVLNRSLSAAVLLAVPALWILWARKHYLIAALYAAGLLAALAVSEASAAFAAALIGLLAFCAARFCAKFVQAGLAAAGSLALISFPWIAPFLFAHRPQWSYLQTPSTGGRLEIWDFVARAIQVRPELGYGFEATRFMIFQTQQVYHKADTVLHPHNNVLQIWMEYGALGAILALAGWLFTVKHIQSAPALAWLSVALVMGLMSFGLWQSAWLSLLLLSAIYWRAAATSFGSNSQ